MMNILAKAIGWCVAAVALSACSTAIPLDSSERDRIAVLLQRIEALEQRTERNEYAVVGLNRRVTGLANLVTNPPAAYQPQPEPIAKREAYDEQQRTNPSQFVDRSSAGPSVREAEREITKRVATKKQRPQRSGTADGRANGAAAPDDR